MAGAKARSLKVAVGDRIGAGRGDPATRNEQKGGGDKAHDDSVRKTLDKSHKEEVRWIDSLLQLLKLSREDIRKRRTPPFYTEDKAQPSHKFFETPELTSLVQKTRCARAQSKGVAVKNEGRREDAREHIRVKQHNQKPIDME